MIEILIFFWIFISCLVGLIAYSKDRNFIGLVFLSMMISPLISLVFLLIVGKLGTLEEASKDTKTEQVNIQQTILPEKVPDYENGDNTDRSSMENIKWKCSKCGLEFESEQPAGMDTCFSCLSNKSTLSNNIGNLGTENNVTGLVACEFCQKMNKPDVTFCKSCGIKLRG